ncbi:hypothetical protein QR680_017712 [Steinernema hermaphroditum]|uniref:Uncharacterized protein n=1 Tax=Steinernema hermaphroditum TaxID=289476 RepID=A0AA39HGR7_9BILA|nr:hypothetical protein QR680_017712 [Steinernema hermaphroditum]
MSSTISTPSSLVSSASSVDSPTSTSRSSTASQYICARAAPRKKKPSFPRVLAADPSGLYFTLCYRKFRKRCLIPQPLTRDAPLPSDDESVSE